MPSTAGLGELVTVVGSFKLTVYGILTCHEKIDRFRRISHCLARDSNSGKRSNPIEHPTAASNRQKRQRQGAKSHSPPSSTEIAPGHDAIVSHLGQRA